MFVHLFLNYLEMGIKGVALAHNLSAVLGFTILCTYLSRQKDIAEAWYWPTRRTFYNLKEFLLLAIPGVLMLLLENSNMQILLL
jgi:Na+-driven multidrug efflux pump